MVEQRTFNSEVLGSNPNIPNICLGLVTLQFTGTRKKMGRIFSSNGDRRLWVPQRAKPFVTSVASGHLVTFY